MYSRFGMEGLAAHADSVSECASCPIREASFCDGVPSSDLDILADHRRHQHFNRQQTITRAGEPARHFFNVVSGVVKLSRSAADGRTQIIGFRFPGEFFAASDEDIYNSTADALTDVTLCRFSRIQLKHLLAKFPELRTRLFEMSNRQIADTEEHLFLLGRKTARERVASFLLAYRRKSGDGKSNCTSLPVTRTEMADFLGLTTETVSRTINQFVRDKLVTIGKPHVINLIDIQTLSHIACPEGFGVDEIPATYPAPKPVLARTC